MKYFKLEYSLDKREIGDYPQIQKFKKGYDQHKPESCSQIGRYYFGIKPDVEIDFDCLQLTGKAKPTDYVSSSYLNSLTGMLISPDLNKFLSHLRLPDHISYSTGLYQKDQLISNGYKWIHFIKSYPETVSFVNSEFFLDHPEAGYKKIFIKSFAEYQEKQAKISYKINSQKLVLNSKYVSRFDVLRIGVVKNETYVTESLKDEMIAKRFTGLVYEPADYLIIS